jgi:hypothetical protein
MIMNFEAVTVIRKLASGFNYVDGSSVCFSVLKCPKTSRIYHKALIASLGYSGVLEAA